MVATHPIPGQSHKFVCVYVIWIQEGFTAERPRNDLGANFSEMIRASAQQSIGVTGQKSELQPGRPPESEPNPPEKGPEWRLGASTENTPSRLLEST